MATIKIIDDDVEFVELLTVILRKEGHDVTSLDTTEGALSVLIEEKPQLLILDVMFPDNPVAGFDLARQIRRRRETRYLPIILLTGVNQEFPMDFSSDDIDSEWMPVQEFVEKPIQADKILHKVAQVLAAD